MAAEAPSGLACPRCQAPLDRNDVICRACGADILLATLLPEYELLEQTRRRAAEAGPVSVEQLAPRLGEYLVSQGYVAQADLQAALDQQAQESPGQPRRLLGQTLVEQGVLTRQALDQAIAERLLELQSSLLEANRTLEQRVVQRTTELQAALARLTELNQLKANFVANISHELRTPLTHIKSYSLLLSDGTLGPLTADQHTGLEVSGRAIERLEQLVADLISYAAAARGELTLTLGPVDLNAVGAEALRRSQAKAERQRVALLSEFPAGLPRVIADEEKLLWTLLQLLDNGIKFTPAGGQVTLAGTAGEEHVSLSVRDTGIGIPRDQLADVFEPFRQLDGSSTRRFGGTGLGLALVQRILEAHGASLDVHSAAGQGTTVTFSLPKA